MKRDPGWASACNTLLRGRLTATELSAFRDRRVRHLVAHAYRHVPHYRRSMRDHGVCTDDITGVADIHRLPMLSKEVLQNDWESLLSEAVDAKSLTSLESTGRNVRAFHTQNEWLMLGAIKAKADARFGRSPRMRSVRVALIRRGGRPDWRLGAARRLGWFRSTEIEGRESPAHVVAELRRVRPEVVGGFPVVLLRAAEQAGPRGLADLGVRMVVPGGAVLTPSMRQTLAEAFGAPVYDTYNCVEFFHLAGKCAHSGLYHVCDESVVLEIVRGDRPAREGETGETGEVVVTGLHQYAVPLIRYRVGDVATKGPDACPCGLPHSTIRRVQGRMDDYFRLPDGRVVYPWRLTKFLMSEHGWVGKYRVVQDRIDRVVLWIEPKSVPSERGLRAISEYCGGVLGPEVAFSIELVDRLADNGELKPRLSVSHVASDYEGFDWKHVLEDDAKNDQPKASDS